MEWRAKVELFEEIRREYEFGIGTVRGVARKLGVHRRQVRQALADARPPARKQPERRRPVLAGLMPFIEAILTSDRQAPRKQRHMDASDLAADQGGMAGTDGGGIDDSQLRARTQAGAGLVDDRVTHMSQIDGFD